MPQAVERTYPTFHTVLKVQPNVGLRYLCVNNETCKQIRTSECTCRKHSNPGYAESRPTTYLLHSNAAAVEYELKTLPVLVLLVPLRDLHSNKNVEIVKAFVALLKIRRLKIQRGHGNSFQDLIR